MLEIKINFTQIQSRIDAARSLQDAGQNDSSKSILLSLANDITEKLEQQKKK